MDILTKKCSCPKGAQPFFGEGFSRREFMRVGATGLVASWFASVTSPSLLQAATAVSPRLHNTARNCILIFLNGGPPQTDMWDLKEGAWLPADFAPTSYGQVRWPQGLMPKLATHLDKLAIIRSASAWAAVHPLAARWSQIARNPTGAGAAIAPHIGAVVALETSLKRTDAEVLPGFLALGANPSGSSGYLSASNAPFQVTPSPTGLSALVHPDGKDRIEARWKLAELLDADRANGELGRDAMDQASYYTAAKRLIDTPNVNGTFTFTTEERTRYGTTVLGDSLIVARNTIASGLGTRFVQVTQGGWDLHANIYVRPGGIYGVAGQLDNALGALLTDLSTMPGHDAGKTLLDETMVVVFGEFGRTVGNINGGKGRDHFLRQSVVLAGGGIKGGRVIGATDTTGAKATEYGWRANRDVRPEDVTATIYSALGIDYTTVRRDDPTRRGFEYVPGAKDGAYEPVSELF